MPCSLCGLTCAVARPDQEAFVFVRAERDLPSMKRCAPSLPPSCMSSFPACLPGRCAIYATLTEGMREMCGSIALTASRLVSNPTCSPLSDGSLHPIRLKPLLLHSQHVFFARAFVSVGKNRDQLRNYNVLFFFFKILYYKSNGKQFTEDYPKAMANVDPPNAGPGPAMAPKRGGTWAAQA